METTELDKLRFPIGRFTPPSNVTPEMRKAMCADVAQLPQKMRTATEGLTAEQLETPYREGGWTVRQTVHHVADSHMNALLRFKLALTQDTPTICPYNQGKWAELPDVRKTPIEVSLSLLEALHARWVNILEEMSDSDFAREYLNPDGNRIFRLDVALALYSWHSRHHVAHITSLRERNGW